MNLLQDLLLGESLEIAAVRGQIERFLARSTSARRLPPILIQGETGTGKGLVARAFHRAGPRRTGPFVDVNCAAIPEGLLEAEMFGFERGAFTDARQAKRGLFQAAHQGTLFLDEIGLLPAGLQAKLLKVIEERLVRRLGSIHSEPVDVCIITATNTDLSAATRERRFREDLYHRLAVLTVSLPPLRERGADALLLGQHFLARASADYGRPPKIFAPDARAALLAYPWPGNVRELANVMERVALLSEAPVVSAAMLGLPRQAPAPPAPPSVAREPDRPPGDGVESVERAHLERALRDTGWNVSRAAARLGVSRNTLRYRIEKHGLRPGTTAPPGRRAPRVPPAPGIAAPLPAPPADPGPAAVRWDRRRLTVVRAMLADRSGGRDPLGSSRALEMFVDKIQSFGGRVEELSTSGVVGVFGLGSLEHASWRAANAALAIHRAAVRARQGDVGRMEARVGVHVASFMVGRVGGTIQLEGDAKREAWSAIDELMLRVEPGSTLVSAAAAPFLERRFDLVPVGLTHGVPASRLVGSEDELFEPARRLTPFVGRRREIQLMRSLLEDARAGHGQVVGMVGDAGIGKSRLLDQFRESLGAEPVTYLEAHCVEYGAGLPFLPILEILRQSCRLGESDLREAIVQKVRLTLADLEMDADEWAPHLLRLLGVREGTEHLDQMSPEAVRARSAEALRQVALHGSRRRPLILAIEDIQWVDSMSEALIASLAEGLQGAQILLVATYRPGHRPSWMDSSYATQIALGPLSSVEGLRLIRSVLRVDRVPPPLAEAVLGKAQGNPFFIEELTRALGERGVLGRIPDTVQEALLARLDRLPDDAKRLVQTASVLGREFSRRLLREVWPHADTLDGHLRELTRQEILQEATGGNEPGYVFRHALAREVVYGSLLDDQRRQGHAAAGRALERLFAGRTGEIVEFLAHHFGRSEESERAVDYALLAGEQAQRRWADAEAVAHFQGALTRLDTLPDTRANRLRRIDAIVKQAEVKVALGQHAAHIEALEAIRPIVETVADPSRHAAWYYWTGFLHSLTGSRPDVPIAYCREAVRIAEAANLGEIRAFAECCLAHVLVLAGEFHPAIAVGQRALEAFETRGNAWWACRALWALAPAANALGDWSQALGYCRRAADHARTIDDLRLRVVALWRTGSTHILRGEPELGVRSCDEALALSPAPFDAAMARATRGHGLVRAGRAAEGTADLEDAVVWFERAGLRHPRLSFVLRLVEGYLRRGDRKRARGLAEEVLAVSRELGYRYLEAMAHRLLGEALVPESPDAGRHEREIAIRMLGAMGARDELARAHASASASSPAPAGEGITA